MAAIPQPNPTTTIVPVSGISAGIHEFVGVSWHVLLPYTLLGAGLMTYSHVRLVRGQYMMDHQSRSRRKAKRNQLASKLSRPVWGRRLKAVQTTVN